jgi:NAD-dependent dihydropyrimidine dehydrogenase PreA subunit
MKVTRKIIEIDEERCDGCGQCVPSCAEGALEIVDGKARMVAERYCDGLGACLGECPNGALRVIERQAEEFDEEAVEAFLAQKPSPSPAEREMIFTGCPSSRARSFEPAPDAGEAASRPAASALSNWPVQILLVPPEAPFLRGADLLVAADCTPLAYPDLHRDFLKGRVVLMGCPKFDDVKTYVEKLAAIFTRAGVRSITTLMMEVPCCSGLRTILTRAMRQAGVEIPLEEVVIGTRGQILEQRRIV